MALKYHLDENMPHAVASRLKQRGLDVTTSTDASLIGATDEEQLAYTLSQNRVLVTQDDDLLVLHSQRVPHAGIAFAPPRQRTIGQIVVKLMDLHRNRESADMLGRVEFLSFSTPSASEPDASQPRSRTKGVQLATRR